MFDNSIQVKCVSGLDDRSNNTVREESPDSTGQNGR